jgi:hypothetical protein
MLPGGRFYIDDKEVCSQASVGTVSLSTAAGSGFISVRTRHHSWFQFSSSCCNMRWTPCSAQSFLPRGVSLCIYKTNCCQMSGTATKKRPEWVHRFFSSCSLTPPIQSELFTRLLGTKWLQYALENIIDRWSQSLKSHTVLPLGLEPKPLHYMTLGKHIPSGWSTYTTSPHTRNVDQLIYYLEFAIRF